MVSVLSLATSAPPGNFRVEIQEVQLVLRQFLDFRQSFRESETRKNVNEISDRIS